MKRGPTPGKPGVDAIARARAAWGDPLPVEIMALAEACTLRPAARVAAEIGYSPAVVSNVLARKYPGDRQAVFARIRGVLLGEQVACPVLGDIGRDQCLDHQKPRAGSANPTRARLKRACPSCQHNRSLLKEATHDA
jgi:hypothetical protein